MSVEPTYVSLYSGAGIGCHGLSMAGFRCIATVEIISRRLNVQKFNRKCADENSYICGNLEEPDILNSVVRASQTNGGTDVVIATPPCQGMSVFNHKKKDENRRNSLVISAIEAVQRLHPKIFIFENVALFFKTQCELPNGHRLTIGEAINTLLGEKYHILPNVLNLKNFGCPSSRTRALAIGVEKNIDRFSPLSLLPDWEREKTLAEVIGDLPPISQMGQICEDDAYHAFKPYAKRMEAWVSGLREGQSAFEQKSPLSRPHQIINGKIVENKNGNGDKYRRQRWNAVPPCVHTRNDILSSQNTIHPRDDRVFSIREIMRMLGIPDDFQWSAYSPSDLSRQPLILRQKFLREHEMNIRQCLGEAVPPTVVFNIAHKIRQYLLSAPNYRKREILPASAPTDLFHLIQTEHTSEANIDYLMRRIECTNEKKAEHAAYYTPPATAFKVIQMLPNIQGKKHIRILEPSCGAGQILRFLPSIMHSYESVEIDAMDIDKDVLEMAKKLAKHYPIPRNVKINFIHGDFLDYPFGDKVYDIIIGNPPFRRMLMSEVRYYENAVSQKLDTRNIFAFFLTKSAELARHVILICPKSILNSPEYNTIRQNINLHHAVRQICDFGEEGFKGVKIETLAIAIETNRKQKFHNHVLVESVPRNIRAHSRATDIFAENLPYWVIYRDSQFDAVLDSMIPGVFGAFRDRQITKRNTQTKGEFRVIKSRNVQPGGIHYTNDDVYINPDSTLAVQKYANRKNVFLVPNLSYYPRACFLPKNSVPDGSVAILYPQNNEFLAGKKDLAFLHPMNFAIFIG